MKAYYKLVRDKIPDYLEGLNKEVCFRVLEEKDYERMLFSKLKEETDEVFNARTEPDKVLKEIADVYETLDAIKIHYGITEEVLIKVKESKKAERGGFEKRIFLEMADK